MFKGILILAALYLLYSMVKSERRKKAAKAKEDTQHLAATGELVKDPICGVYVEKESAISARDGDVVHHFCGYGCRDAFLRQRGILPGGNDANTQDKA